MNRCDLCVVKYDEQDYLIRPPYSHTSRRPRLRAHGRGTDADAADCGGASARLRVAASRRVFFAAAGPEHRRRRAGAAMWARVPAPDAGESAGAANEKGGRRGYTGAVAICVPAAARATLHTPRADDMLADSQLPPPGPARVSGRTPLLTRGCPAGLCKRPACKQLEVLCLCVPARAQMAKSIGSALGSGFAGITKSLDEIGEQLDAEQSAEGKSAQKKGFFEGRDERIQAGSKRPSALLSLLLALLPSSPSLRCLWMSFRSRLTADREEPRAAGAQRRRRRIWASMFAPGVPRCFSTPLPLLCCLPACACAVFSGTGSARGGGGRAGSQR
jgi:hypothetical protein